MALRSAGVLPYSESQASEQHEMWLLPLVTSSFLLSSLRHINEGNSTRETA